MKLRVWQKALLCDFGKTVSKKVNPDKFHLLLSDKKFIMWIFVMRRGTMQKNQPKSQCCGKNFIFNESIAKKMYC